MTSHVTYNVTSHNAPMHFIQNVLSLIRNSSSSSLHLHTVEYILAMYPFLSMWRSRLVEVNYSFAINSEKPNSKTNSTRIELIFCSTLSILYRQMIESIYLR